MTVIGSAEVTIRAVTTGLNADIQKALREARAGVRAEGDNAGSDYADGFGKSISRDLANQVHGALGDIDLSGHGSSAASSFSRGFRARSEREAAESGDRVGRAFKDGWDKRVNKAGSGPGLVEKLIGGDFDSKISSSANALKDFYNMANFKGTGVAVAAQGISSLVGMIGLLGATAASAAPAVMAIPGALMAVAQAGGVAAIAMKGIGKAITAGLSPQPVADTTKATAAMAKQAAQAAKQVEAANERMGRVIEDNARRSRDALQRVEKAEQDLGDAQKDVLRTQLALNDAREAGAESLQQLGFQAEDAALSEQRAALTLEDAYNQLLAVQNLPPDNRSRQEAELAFKEAELGYREAKDRAQDLAKEQEKAAEAGVDGTKEVVGAQDDIIKAQKKAADASDHLRDARENAADVERQNARAIEDATQALADAQQALADVGKESTAATKTVDKFAQAMDKLSEPAKGFVNAVIDSKDAWRQFKDDIGEPIFNKLTPAFQAFTTLFTGPKGLKSAFVDTGTVVGDVIEQFTGIITKTDDFGNSISGIQDIIQGNNDILGVFTKKTDGAASTVENLTQFLLDLGNAVRPVTMQFAEWISRMVASWAQMSETGTRLGSLQEVFTNAGKLMGKIGGVFRNIWDTMKNAIIEAQGPINSMLDMLADLTGQMKGFSDEAVANGKLTEYFQGVADNMKPLLELAGKVSLVFLKMGASPDLGKTLEILKGAVEPLAKVFEQGSKAGPAFAELVVAVTKLMAAFAESGALTLFFNVLTKIVDAITWIIGSEFGQKILLVLGPIHAVLGAVSLVIGLLTKFGPGLLAPIMLALKGAAKLTALVTGGGGAATAAAATAGGARGGGDDKDKKCECKVTVECKCDCGKGGAAAGGGRRVADGGSATAGGTRRPPGMRRPAGDTSLDLFPEDDVRDRLRPSPAASGAGAAAGSRASRGGDDDDDARATKKVGIFKKAAGGLGNAFGKVGSVVSSLIAGPFGLLMKILPFLAAAFTTLMATNEGFRNAVQGVLASLGEVLSNVMTQLAPIFDQIGPMISGLMEAIGPLLQQLATTFGEVLVPAIQQLVPIVQQVFSTFGQVIGSLIPVIMPIIQQIVSVFVETLLPAIQQLLPVVGQVFGAIMEVIGGVISAVLPLISTLITSFAEFLIPVIQSLLPVFTSVFGMVVQIFEQLIPVVIPIIMTIISTLVDTLLPVIQSLLPVVEMIFTTIGDVIKQLLPVVMKVITQIVGVLVSTFIPLIQKLLPVFQTVLMTVMDLFQQLIPVVIPVLQQIITTVVSTLIPVIESLMPVFTQVITLILGLIEQMLPVILPVITQIVDLLVGIFIPVIQSLMPVFTTVLNLVMDLVRNLLPVVLPVFNEIIKMLTTIFIPLIQSLMPIFTSVFGILVQIIQNFLPPVMSVITTLVDLFKKTLIPAVEAIKPVVETIFNGIQTVIEGVFAGISWAYDNVIKPVWNAFQTALDWLGGAFTNFSNFIAWAWYDIQKAFVAPINWIITALNWLIEALNWVITKFGMDPIKKIESITVTAPASPGGGKPASPTGGNKPFATGGYVSGPGGDTDDMINARLSNGEYVLRSSVVRRIGRRRLDLVNFGGMTDAMPDVAELFRSIKVQPGQQMAGLWDWVSEKFGDAVNWAGDRLADATGFVGSLMKEGVAKGLDLLLDSFVGDYLDKPEAGWVGPIIKQWVVGLRAKLKEWGSEKDDKERSEWEAKQAAAMAMGSNGMWGPGIPYTSGRFAVNTEAARQFIHSDFGMPLGDLGGLYGGSVPGSDHAMGKAIDAMIKGWNTPPGIALGDRIAKWFLDNPNEFGTKYVIWRKQYAEPGKGWTGYSHPGGSNPTLDHYDHVHLSFLTGPGEFVRGGGAIAGGDPANLSGPPPGAPPGAGATRLQNTVDPIVNHGAMNMARGTMANVGPLPPGDSVERWRPLYLYALQMAGQSTQWINAMMNQMRTESTGNPLAYNGYDRNAQNGYPSKGLLQTIPSTFRTHAYPGYSTNIWDPLSNALASIRYVLKRYGSLAAGYRGVAYDTGGMLKSGRFGVNLSGKPERILSPSQTEAFESLVMALTAPQSLATNDMSNRDLLKAIKDALSSRLGGGDTQVRVFIGQTELTDIVATQVYEHEAVTARSIALGRKP